MSMNTALWAHLPGPVHGHVKVALAPTPHDPPPRGTLPAPTPRRRRRVTRVIALLGLILIALLALEPDRAEAQVLSSTTRLTGATQVSTGARHGCARLSDGRARCWGDGASYALGNGSSAVSTHATLVRNPAGTGPLTGVKQ